MTHPPLNDKLFKSGGNCVTRLHVSSMIAWACLHPTILASQRLFMKAMSIGSL